jgi:uncharacterized protein (TIGR00369 family)
MSTQAALVVDLIGRSPFAQRLGIRVEAVDEGVVRAHLPWDPALTTVGDQIHGGALASLVDVAATAAAWCTRDLPTSPRGTTIGFQIQFLAAARAEAVVADARVVQRGRSITVVEVVGRGADGRALVQALVTYKLSGEKRPPDPAKLVPSLLAGRTLAEQKELLAALAAAIEQAGKTER